MDGIGGALASPAAVANAARPRIGADRFRALAERLKKPVATDVPAAHVSAAMLPAVFSAPAAVIAQPATAVPVPVAETLPVQPRQAEVVALPEIPAFHVPDFAVPAYVVPAPELPVEIAAAPLEPALPSPADPEPLLAPVSPAPAVLAKPPDFEAAPWPELPPSREASPQLSPLERVLSSQHSPVAAQALPEILPPPPPPPPPLIVEENGEKVTLEAPPMELVQERLREDATNRLLQLDIENIWRQVLAKPTLEERADYLREAAELTAAEQGAENAMGDVPAEFDLSRIAEASPDAVKQAEESHLAPRPYPQTDEQMETAELARSLLDMMASGASSGLPHERALAADTLLRLLPKLAVKTLAMLAHRLAIMDNPPHLLVAKLIRDDRLEVSGPLLEDCMHITDQDLLMVVGEANPGKRRMVARRRKLSRVTSDKLIATDDPSVLLTLVRNANAEISHDGFVALTASAARHPDLMAPLATRADLSAPNAFELFWAAPAQLRRYLLHRFLTDSETLTKILKITLSAQVGDDGKDKNLPSAGEVMELLDMACRGRTETASEKLGEALGVDGATVVRILQDSEGEALIVMLKAAGYPRSAVADLLPALKRGEFALINAEREIGELQTMFDTLSLNKARILLTYWDWAVRKSGPYAPVH